MREKIKHMVGSWGWIVDHVDVLSLRERMLLFITLLAGVFYIWNLLVFGAYGDSEETFKKRAEAARSQIQTLETQITSVSENLRSDPVIALSQRIDQLKKENKEIEGRIAKLTEQLIPPREMTRLLNDLLQEQVGLTVVRMENLVEKPLFTQTQEQNEDGETKVVQNLQVYKHGLELELKATFFGAKEFLEQLESLQWKLLWDEFDYQVDEYPFAKIRLVVHTLSLEEGWISA